MENPEATASRHRVDLTISIRPEIPADADAITRLTAAAFAPMPFSDGSEAPIVLALRAEGLLTLSLVAEADGVIVGHVAFSPVTISDPGGSTGEWLGLGPISVQPGLQRQGIGRALVAAGLRLLEDRGARGCVLIGDPRIYSRLGFSGGGALRYRDLDPVMVQWVAFGGPAPRGELRFAAPFEAAA